MWFLWLLLPKHIVICGRPQNKGDIITDQSLRGHVRVQSKLTMKWQTRYRYPKDPQRTEDNCFVSMISTTLLRTCQKNVAAHSPVRQKWGFLNTCLGITQLISLPLKCHCKTRLTWNNTAATQSMILLQGLLTCFNAIHLMTIWSMSLIPLEFYTTALIKSE